MNRRDFFRRTTGGFANAVLITAISPEMRSASAQLNMPIGFQTFPIRDMLAKDFAGTLKMMAGLGYQTTEMCSPAGYKDIGFGPLVDMKTSDMKRIINDSGLSCFSCHFGFGELDKNLDSTIEFAHGLGLSQMICSTFWLPKEAKLDDYLHSADQLNTIARKIKAAGLQAGFHNHDFEFHELDGQLIYDALMKRFDPDLVKMQFQTEVITLGYKGSTYFNKYPGRFISAHLSDWAADKKQMPVGQGVIDWKEFFKAAKTGGVKNIFVEMDMDKFKPSADYLKAASF